MPRPSEPLRDVPRVFLLCMEATDAVGRVTELEDTPGCNICPDIENRAYTHLHTVRDQRNGHKGHSIDQR